MQKIPKIIHYCWVGKTPKPQSVQYCINSWKKYCPDYEIIEWNEDNYDFKKNQYMKEAYESKKWGFVPDYARLDIIYNYGGIYFDTDVELVSNIESLLQYEVFMGFENTGDGELYVNCGHGFGAVKGNEFIKKERDEYKNVHFINEDGTLNMLPSPHYTTKVLCEYGLKRKNIDQNIQNIKVFSSDVLCPKNFRTGKLHKTNRTLSIHHFTASWLDEKIKKEMKHQQVIFNIFGKKIGEKILYIESVFNKYKLSQLITLILSKLINKLKGILIQRIDDLSYIKGLLKAKKTKLGMNKPILLDTFIESDNCGDHIIMENCERQLEECMDVKQLIHIPTHRPINEEEYSQLKSASYKILCGTNILSGHMKSYGLWKLGSDVSPFVNTVLMGVGFDSSNEEYDQYTCDFFNTILNKKYIHSVRDSFSEKKLKSMGIKNVINTSCPTMWNLTPEKCSQIPQHRSTNVITTLTDYNRDETKDSIMLNILLENYQDVYFWIQGKDDLEYIDKLGYKDKVKLVNSTLNAYDDILKQDDLDYVGTRLHAGIRAMSFNHRSIIIAIDNRARSIAKDTGIHIIERDEIESKLFNKLSSSFETLIRLPRNNIDKWKNQFKDI
ncbi:MAG: polysaccharide pyruvyl transferase family protein [Traorella sp.]